MQQCRVEEVDEVIKLTEQGLVIEASSEEEDLEAENLLQQQALARELISLTYFRQLTSQTIWPITRTSKR